MQNSKTSVCEGAHRFFVVDALSGTVEGMTNIKLYAVLACTVCGESQLLEHIVDKQDAAKLTQKEK